MKEHRTILLALTLCLLATAGLAAPEEVTIQKLEVDQPNQLWRFGSSVAIAKKLAVIGAPSAYTSPDPTGTFEIWNGGAWVFRQVAGEWVEEARLSYEGATNDDFAAMGRSTATDGTTVLVGAPSRFDGRGAAFIFEQVAGVWTQVAELKGRKRATDGLFGWSVAVEGDWILVGAPGDGNGRVFAYSRDPGSGKWLPAGELEPEEGKGGTGTKLNFGRSLAMDRGRAAVGAPGHDGPGNENSDMGSAYVFVLKNGMWEQEAWLLPSDGTRWWYNGEAVDIDRRTVVVGSRGDWGDRGAAYVYERKGKNWVEKQRLDPSQTDEFQYAGSYALAISGRRVLLGAPLDDEAGGRSGAVYLFMKRGKDWIEEERIRPADLRADDAFGVGVDLFRRFMLVGADGGDTSGRDGVGAAYVIK